MTEVFLRFFEHAADAFLFGDISIELLNVTLRLFGAFVLGFSARPLGFFRMTRRRFHFAHVTVVAEVNDDDDRDADEKRPEARCAKTANDETRARGTREVTDRDPEKVARPRPPQRLARFECAGGSAQAGMDHVLHDAHQTEPDNGHRRTVSKKSRRRSEREVQDHRIDTYCARKRAAAES